MYKIFIGISAFSSCALLALALATVVKPKIQFWPPPSKGSWQDLVFIWLFRGMVYALIASSVVTVIARWPLPLINGIMGGVLILGGFAGAFAFTGRLGWRNAFGDRKGLVTTGAFSWSRNPIYVSTWVGLAGWAILIPDIGVRLVLLVWGLLYAVAARLEEPWLEREYGDQFRDYCGKVPRFLIFR